MSFRPVYTEEITALLSTGEGEIMIYQILTFFSISLFSTTYRMMLRAPGRTKLQVTTTGVDVRSSSFDIYLYQNRNFLKKESLKSKAWGVPIMRYPGNKKKTKRGP